MRDLLGNSDMQEIDVDAKIRECTTENERLAWEDVRERVKGVGFQKDWDVWIYLHRCGHYEVLQNPNPYRLPIPVLRSDMQEVVLRDRKECTECSMRRSDPEFWKDRPLKRKFPVDDSSVSA